MVQWLRFHASTERGMNSIPVGELRFGMPREEKKKTRTINSNKKELLFIYSVRIF